MSQQNLIHEFFFLLMIFTSILCSLPMASTPTLDMVRRDSFDFDLFPKNLSSAQKNRIFAQLSHFRARRLSAQVSTILKPVNSSVVIDTIQPPMKQFLDNTFAISMGIGSRPYNTYLVVDTGSNQLWVQCQGCNHCFQIKNGPFNSSASSSYHTIPVSDPLCQPRIRFGNSCGFNITYIIGYAAGSRALESLKFHSTDQGLVTIPNILLGCANIVRDWTFGTDNDGPHNVISGVFGLTLGYTKYGNSFMELTRNITKMKFSYCLPSWDAPKSKSISLSFGDAVTRLSPPALSTPMETTMYYLSVHDISVGGTRLQLDPNLFKKRRDGGGGFIIDSGSGFSMLVKTAYDKMQQALVAILANHGKHPVESPPSLRNFFCYKWPLMINHPPSVTYHMENADLEVSFENLFVRENIGSKKYKKYFACMTFLSVSDQGVSILGAAQQADHRFVYDLEHQTMQFKRDRC